MNSRRGDVLTVWMVNIQAFLHADLSLEIQGRPTETCLFVRRGLLRVLHYLRAASPRLGITLSPPLRVTRFPMQQKPTLSHKQGTVETMCKTGIASEGFNLKGITYPQAVVKYTSLTFLKFNCTSVACLRGKKKR